MKATTLKEAERFFLNNSTGEIELMSNGKTQTVNCYPDAVDFFEGNAISVTTLPDDNNSTKNQHVTGGLEFTGACVVESHKVIGDDGKLDMDAVTKCFEDARGKAEDFLNDEL